MKKISVLAGDSLSVQIMIPDEHDLMIPTGYNAHGQHIMIPTDKDAGWTQYNYNSNNKISSIRKCYVHLSLFQVSWSGKS